MKIRFEIVDVFAENSHEGNQLAVFYDPEEALSHDQMLKMAKEINFAESTFVGKSTENATNVRIFTTEYEMPFAGHPTLGTAAVLMQGTQIKLNLKIGEVPVSRKDNKYELSLEKFHKISSFDKAEIAKSLQLDANIFHESLACEIYSAGYPFLILPIKDAKSVSEIQLEAGAVLKFLKDQKIHKTNSENQLTVGLFFVGHSALNNDNQIHTRMFLLQDGVLLEDPATGSAHAALAGYYIDNGHFGPNFCIKSEQGYEIGRPSLLYLSSNNRQIYLAGKVQKIAEGSWKVPVM